jgi:hypothetical protein
MEDERTDAEAMVDLDVPAEQAESVAGGAQPPGDPRDAQPPGHDAQPPGRG